MHQHVGGEGAGEEGVVIAAGLPPSGARHGSRYGPGILSSPGKCDRDSSIAVCVACKEGGMPPLFFWHGLS